MNDIKIGKRIAVTSNQLKRIIESSLVQNGIDISTTQSRIIRFVYNKSLQAAVFQKDIEEEFGIRRSSVTSLLQHLEKNHYIVRERVLEDGRQKKIILTEKGIGVYSVVSQVILTIENTIYDQFTEEELILFSNFIEKVSFSLSRIGIK